MTPSTSPPPPPVTAADLLKVTLEQYHRMGETGILTPDDRVELLDGILVTKPMKKPPHVTANRKTRRALEGLPPGNWFVNAQEPVTLDDSEPEPDVSLILGPPGDYDARHPVPAEIALVVEVADSSLPRDRDWKKRIYARNAIPVYWIVNLVDRVLEVYADPSGPVLTPDYGTARFLKPGDSVDVVVAGSVVGTIPVAELFP
jgi:Uma2 family endonuclease